MRCGVLVVDGCLNVPIICPPALTDVLFRVNYIIKLCKTQNDELSGE